MIKHYNFKPFFAIAILFTIQLIFSINNNSKIKNNYNNDKLITNEDAHYNAQSISISPIVDNSITGNIGKLDGIYQISEANINKNTETAIHILINANQGKAKIVLVKPNSEVEILKEVIAKKENSSYNGSICIHCASGVNKIKLVGENYRGNFKISQPNGIIFKTKNT